MLVLDDNDDSEGMTRLIGLVDKVDNCSDCKGDFDWLCKFELAWKLLERPWTSKMALTSGKSIINIGKESWRYIVSAWAWHGCCSGGAAIKGEASSSTLESWWFLLLSSV